MRYRYLPVPLRDRSVITSTVIVCPGCGTKFEGTNQDYVRQVYDEHKCPNRSDDERSRT